MTFRSLALNNIRGNWRAYAAFFLSCVFSVFIFYLYASFVNHPDIINGYIKGADQVRPMIRSCMYLIVIFTFFFVLYANSSFIKTRKKEFGLLLLFGTTRFQLRKMVVYESLTVALLSITTGIGLGMLFSKLFFMALGALLQPNLPLRFTVPLPALLLTLIGFAVLFVVIALLTALKVGRTEIIDLLGAIRKLEKPPVTSPLLTALAMLALGTGYIMATMVTGEAFIPLALPIIGLTVVGTYFLYTQLSTAVIKLLQRSKRFYYCGTNLLTVSQMAFRIKNNSRMLFLITILATVVMSAASTVYAIQIVSRDKTIKDHPFTVVYFEGEKSHSVMAPGEMAKRLQESGAKIAEQVEISGLKAEKMVNEELGWSKKEPMNAIIIPLSDYNKLAPRVKLPQRQLNDGASADREGFFVVPSYYEINNGNKRMTSVTGFIGNKPFELTLTKPVFGEVTGPIPGYGERMFVVPDRQLSQWKKISPASTTLRFYGFELHDWEHQLNAVKSFKKGLTADQLERTQTYRLDFYQDIAQSITLTVFIGLFISALFFIASGSLLYFKLFTELQEDRSQFRALYRIGLTASELRRVIGMQVTILFLLPCLVGIVHSLFAMLTLGTLMQQPVWMYGLVIMGVYTLMQAAYGFISHTLYTRNIIRSVAG